MDIKGQIYRIVSEVYPLIKSANPCWTVIIYGIIVTPLTIVGILLNCSVVFITFRTKSFRGFVNILLALYSVCEIANLSGNFLSIYSAFSGHYFMPFKSAFRLTIVSFMAVGCAINLLLFMGIERLIVVLFPLKLTLVAAAILEIGLDLDPVPSNSNSAQFNKRIFRSLCSIVFVNVAGYMIGFCYVIALQLLTIESAIIEWHANQIIGILMRISAASNGQILYLTSSEYREAFRKEFADG